MKKLILLSIAILLFPLIVSSQSEELEICIRNSEGGNFENVNLALLQGSNVINGGITGSDGCFPFSNLDPNQQYEIRISHIGYNELQTTINIGEVNSFILEEDVIFLEETIITAPRPELQAISRAEIVNGRGGLFGNCNFGCEESQISLNSGDSISFSGEDSSYANSPLFDPNDFTWYFITDPFDVLRFNDLVNQDAPLEEFRFFLSTMNREEQAITTIRSFSLTDENFEFFPEFEGQQQFAVLEVSRTEDFFDYDYGYYIQSIDVSCHSGRTGPNCGEEVVAPTQPTQPIQPTTPREQPTVLEGVTETLTTRLSCLDSQEGATCDSSGFLQPTLFTNTQCKTLPSGHTQIIQNGELVDNVLFNSRVPSSCNNIPSRCTEDSSGVIVHTADDCCQEPQTISCDEGYVCFQQNGLGACKLPNFESLESSTGTEAAASIDSFELPPTSIAINIEITGSDLINGALCNEFSDEFLAQLVPIEASSPPQTAAVIKQITGFFSKVTGKQTAEATSQDSRFSSPGFSTQVYSELANSKNLQLLTEEAFRLDHPDQLNPHIPIIHFSDTGTALNKFARFLDPNIGSALMNSFDYSQEDIDSLISTAEANGQILAKKEASHLTIRKGADIRYDGGNDFKIPLPSRYYQELRVSEPSHTNRLGIKFLIVETTLDRYFIIEDEIFSVSAGLYLVPASLINTNYRIVDSPKEVRNRIGERLYELYYDLPSDVKGMKYIAGLNENGENEYLHVQFLTPSEGHFLMRNFPENFPNNFRLIVKSFTYKRETLSFAVIPINQDYGDFERGTYYVPAIIENNKIKPVEVISMDNENDLRNLNKPELAFKPPVPYNVLTSSGVPDSKLVNYEFNFFEILNAKLKERRDMIAYAEAHDFSSNSWRAAKRAARYVLGPYEIIANELIMDAKAGYKTAGNIIDNFLDGAEDVLGDIIEFFGDIFREIIG